MASLTVANYLGMLQDNPEDQTAFDGLREALQSGDPERVGEQPLRLLEAARHSHERRGDFAATAWLIELEVGLSEDDPGFQAVLLKELGRLRREELLDDTGAAEAYRQALALQPDDDVEIAVEEIEQSAERWREIADRFIQEAEGASDAALKSSMLARAGALVWQYRKKGRARETDKLFKAALKADITSTRAANLYCVTLRARDRWGDVASVLEATAQAARNRDTKLNLFVQAARVSVLRTEDKDKAAACYERVLDFSPGHEEALGFLVEHFTEKEDWDHLVSLYEDALRARQKLESEQGILLQIGMVHWRIRSAPELAEPYFARLRKIDPAHPGMLSFYRSYLGDIANGEDADAAGEARTRLLTILGDAQRVAKDNDQKLVLAVELARAAQAVGATERAIDAWKAVQRLDGTHEEAGVALRDLYRRGEKWNALVETMRAELDALPAKSEDEEVRGRRVALLKELIAIYRDELKLDVMVINTYNALLAETPEDASALRELAQTYEQMGRWNDLIQVLRRQADAEEDPAEKVALLMRVAGLWVDRFANYNQATKPLEAVIEAAPDHREALHQLKTIYTKKRSWKSLYGVLEKEVLLVLDPEARLALQTEMAKLAGERLHRNADAIALWREILDVAPETEGALDTLEKLSEREKDWATLAEALEMRVPLVEDGKAKIKVLQKLGTVYGEHLKDPTKAADSWKRVLELDPKNGRALRTLREAFLQGHDWEGLRALYAEAQDWEGLVDVFGNAAERTEDPEVKVELSFRAAAIYEGELGNPERAFRSYERVLSVQPKNHDAALKLIPIYENQEKWPRLVALREMLLEELPEDAGVEERLEALGTLRDLYANRLRDESGAFVWATEAYALAPTAEGGRELLEASADAAGAHEDLLRIYTDRVAAEIEDDERSALRRRIAAIAGERLGRIDEAVVQLEEILRDEPRDEETISILDRLYRAQGQSEKLQGLLEHRLEQSEGDAEKSEVLLQLAELEETVLDDADKAAGRYRQALELDAGNDTILAALDRLAVAGERHEELAGVLRQRRDIGEADIDELTLRLARLLGEHLGDASGALDEYTAVLDGQPADSRAVGGIEALVASSEDDALKLRAGELLEGAYEATGRWGDLKAVLEHRLAKGEASQRRELQLRLAELAATSLGDADGAYQALEAAFLDNPEDLELWDRLGQAAEAAGKHEALAVAFGTAIEVGELNDADAAQLAARAADIYDMVLGRPEEAEALHRRVLANDSLDARAFEALKELFTNQERWEDLQVLYRNRIAETYDADAKLELLLQVCFLFEEILDNPELAIRSYQEVLELEPEHDPSRRALERLYRSTERWRDLVALLRQEVDRIDEEDTVKLTALTFEIGELHEFRLEEPAIAVDQYEQLLERDPKHVRAQEALERLIGDPGQRQRIAATLEPLYDSQGAWAELGKILEVQLEDISDPSGQLALLTRIADLHENKLHDMDAAFAALRRAVLAEPADAGVREEVARLATIRDAQQERAELLEKAVEKSEGYLKAELLLELGRVWDDELGNAEAAEKTFQQLIDTDADNPESVLPAAQALERLHLAKEDLPALAQDLRLQIQFDYDPVNREELLVRLAGLLELELNDVDGAIAAHRQRLDIDPGTVDALRTLERLYAQQAQWQKLIGVLQSREEFAETEDEQREIALRVGQVYESHLEDVDNAIVAYNDVLSRFGGDEECLRALARLYEKSERWDDLLEVVEMQLEVAQETGGDIAGLRFRASQLMRQHTGDLERAIEGYAEVLAVQPGHSGAVEALEEVLTDGQGNYRVEAARTLVPHYEGHQAYGELIDALEVVAETDDPEEKLRAYRRAAEVAEFGRDDAAQAFTLTGKAVSAGLSEDSLGDLLSELQRHAETSNKWADYVGLLRRVAPDVMDGEIQRDVMMAVAVTARERLDDTETAKEFYQRVLENEPEHSPALDALESLFRDASDSASLLDVLRRKTEIAELPHERCELLRQQGVLSEGPLEDVPSAIDAYDQILNENETDLDAYEALQRLYRRSERWDDLSSNLERQLEVGVGDGVDARYRLGVLHQNELGDTYAALDHFRETLAQDGNHEPSINALEALMGDEEHRGAAAEILEPVFLAQMAWPRVTATLEARIAASDDPEERKGLLARLGQIHQDYLEDLEGALEIYARLFREDPRDPEGRESLERLGRIIENWERLATIYQEALRETRVEEAETAELASRAALLFDEKVGNADAAAELYEQVLAYEATDTYAFEALENIYRRQAKSEDLLRISRARVDVADDGERVRLLHSIAALHEAAGDNAQAIDAHRETLEVDPTDLLSIESLDRLLLAGEQWEDLADHLRFRIEEGATGPELSELKCRLGQLLAHRLDDRHGAVDVFEEVIAEDPNHDETIAALEALVVDEEHRLRITQVLEPIYRAQDEWRKLVAILEAQAAMSDDADEKARFLGEVGRLHEERGADGPRSFDAWSRAFVAAPEDDHVRSEIDRIAGILNIWDHHILAYEGAVQATQDPMRKTELLSIMARVHDERRGDPRSAIQTLERIVEHDADDTSALDALEGLHTMVGDWDGMVKVLSQKVERCFDPIERAELLRRAASVQEELLGDPEGAMELFRRASEEDENDPVALESLDRLLVGANRFEDLAEILQRRIEIEEPALRGELGLRLGQLNDTQLGRPHEAIDAFAAVLEVDANNLEAIEALGRLYERQAMWPELLDNLRLQAALATELRRRVAFVFRSGSIYERELDDVIEAISMYEQVLELDNRHGPALDALIRISHLEDYRTQAAEILEPLLQVQEKFPELISLLRLKAEAASDPFDKKAELQRVAEVAENGLGDLSGAFGALAEAFGEDPSDEHLAEELERLAAASDGFGRLADELAQRASSALDPMVARGLYVRLARIAEERLGDDGRAVEAYARALEQVGDDEELLAALDRLHLRRESWVDLGTVLERRVAMAMDPAERSELLVRLGHLREQQFGDLRGAFSAYQEVVERDPSDQRVLDGLERLGQNEELALDVVDTLEAAYRETGALDRIAGLYDIRLRLADSDGEKVRMLQEAAQLWENDLGEPSKALGALRQAFELDPRDIGLLEEVERLAGMTGAWDGLRGMIEAVVESDELDRLGRFELNLRAASWYRDRLGDLEATEGRLRAAIAIDAEARQGHEELVALLRAPGREEDLIGALRAWADVELDEFEKKERLREAARLAESALGRPSDAADHLLAILAVDGADAEALDALIRIRQGEENAVEVIGLLERRIDIEMDPVHRVGLRRQLAAALQAAEDTAGATAALEAILDEEPEDLDTIGALEGLYEAAERWDDLQGLLDRRLDLAESDEQRISARVRLARLNEQAFGRRTEAMDQLREILEIDPNNSEALDELERLLGLEGDKEALGELLQRRAGDAAAIGDTTAQRAVLLRLADLREDEGALMDAIAVHEEILAIDTTFRPSLEKLIALHERGEDWIQVSSCLERLLPALEGAEAVGVCRRLAEVAETELKDAEMAESALRQAYALMPSATNHELLKAHFEQHEKWASLAQMLELELEGEGDAGAQVALLKRISSLYMDSLGDAATGVAYLERAAELTPDDRDVLLPLCDLYIAAERSTDAVPLLEKIIASFGGRRTKELATYHHRLGQALLAQGDQQGALGHFDAAFKVDLTNVAVLRDLGKLCHSQGDFARAQKTFRALLLQKLGPDSGISKADVCYYLGDISARAGETRKAISMLERSLSENREHAEAAALLAQLKG